MRDVWARIGAAARAMAPGRFPPLPAGAPPEAIAAAEVRLGFPLPADVRESYAVHDGSGGADVLPHAAFGLIAVPLLSLDESLRDREMWLSWREGGAFERRSARPHGPIRPEWWCPRWFPVTWDGGGDHLCIDLAPAPGGADGQVIYFSHEVGPLEVVAVSWRRYLEDYASALEAGRLRFDGDGELVAVHRAEPDPAA
ncbi:MAG: SMI1/KNR4 family protein [Planctomycetes bacterium]|nr:SMI1/KNR4 family protein [Planctomycetota bacterium]